MLEAREGQGPLTEERLFHWHRLLFHGIIYQTPAAYAAQLAALSDRLHETGAFRRSPIAASAQAGKCHALLPEDWTV